MKLFLVALLFSFVTMTANISYACRCEFKYLQEVLKDPKKAQSAFIAVWKNGSFEVKKRWKEVPSQKIKTESSWPGHVTKCDLNLESDKEYLILSTEQTKNPMPLSICATSATIIEESQQLITKLNADTQPVPSSQNMKPINDWFKCERDADCIEINYACAGAVVNKTYAQIAQRYYGDLNAVKNCEIVSPSPETKKIPYKVFCKKNKCESQGDNPKGPGFS